MDEHMAIEPTSFQQVILDQVTVGVRGAISLEFVRDNTLIEADVDHLAQQMAFQLTARVLAEALPPEEIERSKRVEFEVPASWWQHFKKTYESRWWLRWLVRRRPVRMEMLGRTVVLSANLQRYWAYPEAKAIPVDRFGTPVRVSLLSDRVDFRRDLP